MTKKQSIAKRLSRHAPLQSIVSLFASAIVVFTPVLGAQLLDFQYTSDQEILFYLRDGVAVLRQTYNSDDRPNDKVGQRYNNCFWYNNGTIHDVALLFSWEGASGRIPKQEYHNALEACDLERGNPADHDAYCVDHGDHIGIFVSTVLRYSGKDPEFPCCSSSSQIHYLKQNPDKYERLPELYEWGTNCGYEQDRPRPRKGDILVNSNDTKVMGIYIERGCSREIAKAVACSQAAYLDTFQKGYYIVYRLR